MKTNLSFVTVMTADYARARAFYTEVLGFEEVAGRPGDNAYIQSGGAGFALRENKELGADLGAGVTISFSVPDLNAYLKEVQGKGADLAEPLHDLPFGPNFSVRSPDGHVLGFWQEERPRG